MPRINVLCSAPSIDLPDTTYYEKSIQQRGARDFGKNLAQISSRLITFLMRIEDCLRKRLELDRRVAAVVLSNEESSEYAKLYHPYSYEDFLPRNLSPVLPLDDFFQAVLGQVPDKVIVDEERFWKAADQFYSEEAWPLLRATLNFKCCHTLNQLFNRRNPCLVRCL